ncbi:hypothetical protein HCN44_009762 [Aphidius gifuensis]|uniref:Nuclear export mediator factor NEMF homolog n=1 Tax=Aphidius gifuensis TaxID=684658 RepID=A0A834Y6X2_APHGI|nr:nuclear export mediator factor NEMF homolog [Aphidius gifuensis]KAF7998364.1 hypothetical protein HCN44_009762 [Aphidius gifuensis]
MKTRFDTYDLVCSVAELQRLIGMRVNQIYDIDHRTYLIRLQRSEEKCVLLLESGNRIHTTAFEWPKNTAPSGFSMKMRKHLKNKRLESMKQIGTDRIVDLQFGSGEAAYHVILEVYDRGNIILTDYEMTTLNILRPHTEGDKIRFAVREKYPVDRAHTTTMPAREIIEERIAQAKQGETLKKILNPMVEFGAALIDHVLLKAGFEQACKIGKGFVIDKDMDKLIDALETADKILKEASTTTSKGFILQKKESKPSQNGKDEFIMTSIDFHPMILEQYKNHPHKEFTSFDAAVDEYFSLMEGQKLDLKALQQERDAFKKLENVKKDHEQRLLSLGKNQEIDKEKAELITRNQLLVDNAILAVQSAIANQMAWPDIQELINNAQSRGDIVAKSISKLKLETNHITLFLNDPYANISDDSDDDDDDDENKNKNKHQGIASMLVDIDLEQTAYGNATKYYNQKRSAAKKQQKTLESQGKAFKSAEKKTKQTLKEVQTIHSINKARKVYWFEKFYWFITSENYLVIGGRDQQQNELIVKRYLRSGDVYVHADLSGASSLVIKNHTTSEQIPPKSLAEAGTMAIAYSVAWEAKVIAGAWWVHHDQVSKTAPTGEYLTTGSFMIRGKKNYLPPCQLVMGLGFLFRLEDSFIEKHKDERRVKTVEEDGISNVNINTQEDDDNDEEIKIQSDSGEDEDDDDKSEIKLEEIKEENDDDDKSLFPDTQIKLDLSGPKMKIIVDNKNSLDNKKNTNKDDDDDTVIYLGDGKPIKIEAKKSSVSNEKPVKAMQKNEIENKKQQQQKETSGLKRGQKGRLKKMKEKYKDQDEEDRKLLMEVLKSDGAAKEVKRKKNKNLPQKQQVIKKKGPIPQKQVDNNEGGGGGAEIDDDIGPAPDIDMLDQLTGKPFEDDELLFAVPVIAPYNTVLNYKFKVKLMPGTGKRGRAAKTAIAVFLKDKTITPREKDLLKAVKDETIARNIPGKVKISAPQIQKLRK